MTKIIITSYHRADVNACDQFSWTPLHHACHAGQLDIIQLLLEAGASVDPPTLNGATPLMRAIESCRPSCVDYLIKAGAKINAVNKTGTFKMFRPSNHQKMHTTNTA